MARLTDGVQTVSGIGPKKTESFAKAGIRTLEDALQTYPRDYEDRTNILPIAQARDGEKVCVCAVVGTAPALRYIRRGMELTKLTIFDESGTLPVTYFNNKYVAAQLRQGKTYLFYGKVQGEGFKRVMISPEFEPCTTKSGRIVPLYPLTAGVTRRDMERVTAQALDALVPSEIVDCLPAVLRDRYDLLPLSDCLRRIHRPQSMEEVGQARRRIIFEELFLLCCGLARLRERRRDEKGPAFSDRTTEQFWKMLKFLPTRAQRRAVEEIVQDIANGRPMNRLVQGDVGSGKTVIAAALCVLAAQNGYQAAFMAPTEILAMQHAETLAPLFQKAGIHTVVLTGSMKAAAKRQALAQIESGTAQVIIGTHALIQKGVEFCRLGAVVVDEQHRFGVAQRTALSGKGNTPHMLVMSATPIPRTLALLLYGDLDISVLDELPPGRQRIETYAVGENMRQRVYKFMEKQCRLGGQIYVVCPLVEEGEIALKSAEQHAKTLKDCFPNREIGLLHGKMRPAEKDRVMSEFASGKIAILVATTVIEVGVNVPNATLMVVEDADRFGLSQLHQLRGRVGRGNRQSYCIFLGTDKGTKARMRLQTLCHSADGFAIAQEDLAQRGPGDFFGTRQHGLPLLQMANLVEDIKLLQSAQEEARKLLEEDPALAQYPVLKARIVHMFQNTDRGDIFN